ncbi:hypothetical protein EON66_06870, partial [archaeon]
MPPHVHGNHDSSQLNHGGLQIWDADLALQTQTPLRVHSNHAGAESMATWHCVSQGLPHGSAPACATQLIAIGYASG